jgi:hypothetical protein
MIPALVELFEYYVLAKDAGEAGKGLRDMLNEFADSMGLSDEEVFAWVDETFGGEDFSEWDPNSMPVFTFDENGNLVETEDFSQWDDVDVPSWELSDDGVLEEVEDTGDDDFGYDDWSEYKDELEEYFNEFGGSGP